MSFCTDSTPGGIFSVGSHGGGVARLRGSTGRIGLTIPHSRNTSRDRLASWQSEIGFVKGPIEVCAFFDGDKYVGVGPPEDQDCHHVLWWAKDYWLSENGDVEST